MAIRRSPAASYSIAEARDALARIVHEAERGRAVRLTRRGTIVAAIVSVGDLERLRTDRTTFWDAVQEFRGQANLEALWAEGDPFLGTRERASGRAVKL